jgi:hypothetical protein
MITEDLFIHYELLGRNFNSKSGNAEEQIKTNVNVGTLVPERLMSYIVYMRGYIRTCLQVKPQNPGLQLVRGALVVVH